MGNPFKLVKRCFRCLHVLREDGTCQNPKCVRYTPDESESSKSEKTEKESDTSNSGNSGTSK